MEDKVTDYRISYPNLRRRRAEMLTGMVMNQIEQFLRNDEEVDARKHVSRNLVELFSAVGIEIVTDFDREHYGLPPRNPEGYTAEELYRLERARDSEFALQYLNPFQFDTTKLKG